MTQFAIHVDSISKQYRLGQQGGTELGRLSEAMTAAPKAAWRLAKRFTPVRASERESSSNSGESSFWALRDVSFHVKQGEVCGIVGRNGAGKSTLLKVLSRITEPTSGRFGLNGRVSSLLEVGTGFHPELTGRENIFLSGITLGMRRSEVRSRFDEIVEFAGIERFLDTPVKHYSSGMQVRLGFSVAAHLESEILIVDEVLAVGDAGFQKKCLGKLSDVVESGRTALMVSHNMVAIKNLCHSAVLIEEGAMVLKADPHSVVTRYLDSFGTASSGASERLVGSGGIKKIISCLAVDANDQPNMKFSIDDPMAVVLELELENTLEERGYGVVLHFYFDDGTLAFATASPQESVQNGQTVRCWGCHIPERTLNEGQYMVEVIFVSSDFQVLGRFPEMLRFDTVDEKPRGGWYGKWAGVMRPGCMWTQKQQGKP